MNKLEQMHLDTMIVKDLQSASKSAEITKNIAIEFADWLIKELILSSHGKYLSYTPKELFQEFLKTKQ